MSAIQFEEIATEKDIERKIKPSFWRELLDYFVYFIKVFVVVAAFYLIIKGNLFSTFRVDGHSMDPTFSDGEIVYINKITPKFSEYERGDVVIIDMPKDACNEKEDCYYIKRVIGLPGEQVMLEDGEVFIINDEFQNGVKLEGETYIEAEGKTYGKVKEGTDKFISNVLEEDEYFVMGDNRMNSLDSRYYGEFVSSDILGEVFYRPNSGFFDLPTYNISN